MTVGFMQRNYDTPIGIAVNPLADEKVTFAYGVNGADEFPSSVSL